MVGVYENRWGTKVSKLFDYRTGVSPRSIQTSGGCAGHRSLRNLVENHSRDLDDFPLWLLLPRWRFVRVNLTVTGIVVPLFRSRDCQSSCKDGFRSDTQLVRRQNRAPSVRVVHWVNSNGK